MELKLNKTAIVIVLMTGVLVVLTNQTQAKTLYTITDLGTLPGDTSSGALSINASGQVVGYSVLPNKDVHAFVWNAVTGMTSLGPGSAAGINASGQLVGYSINSSNSNAFVWNAVTGMTSLGTGRASGINTSGQVVGILSPGGGFVWRASTGITNIGVTLPAGINDSGHVVGTCVNALTLTKFPQACIWSAGTGMTSLGTLPGDLISFGTAINASGQVVGNSSSNAFLWSADTGMTSLGPGSASGINASGQVVGTQLVGTSTSGHYQAFLWSASTGMEDLTSLLFSNQNHGWTLVSASAINDVGQIVGYGFSPNNEVSAFLLTPKQSIPSIVPKASLPAKGNVGVFYTGSFTATGGVGTRTLSAIGLPSGLSMSGGAISGTPTKAGTFVMTLIAKDSIGQIAKVIKTVIISPAANFTVAATAASLTLKRGASINNTVTIAALYGFKATVNLAITGLPAGAASTFTPSSITGGAGHSTLKLTAASSTKTGVYPLKITATSGKLSNTKTISLTVRK